MSRRLLIGLVVLAAAVAAGLGIWLAGDGAEGGEEPSADTSAPANTERPLPPADRKRGEKDGGGKGGKGGDRQGGSGKGDGPGSAGDGGADGSGSESEPDGPVIKPDPKGPRGPTPPVGPPEDVDAVRATLRTYLLAISRGDGDKACAQLSAAGRAAMRKKLARAAPETRGSPCEQSILLYQGAYGKAIEDPKIKDIRVGGDKATAIGPLQEPARLSRGAGGWLIDDYGQ